MTPLGQARKKPLAEAPTAVMEASTAVTPSGMGQAVEPPTWNCRVAPGVSGVVLRVSATRQGVMGT